MTERPGYLRPGAALPWWTWVLAVHAFFVWALYVGIFEAGWSGSSRGQFTPLSLAHENNIAVWWSGVCLLIPGLMFFSLGLRDGVAMRDRVMWVSLALVILGLSLDEVGSLHERVDIIGGWWALLPFGVVGSAAFAYGVARMLRAPGRRPTAMLVLASLLLFFLVAGLERLESLRFFQADMARSRLVIEEAIELLAEFLLIFAAALEFRKADGIGFNRVSIAVAPRSIPWFDVLLFVALIGHVVAAMLLAPDVRNSGRGNPEIWYPMSVFLLVGFHFAHHPSSFAGGRWAVRTVAVIFVVLSAAQMQNIGEYVVAWWPGVIDESFYGNWHVRALLTALPVMLMLALRVPWRTTVALALALLALLVLLHPGRMHFESYYLFSGVLAFAAYRFLVTAR